MSQQMKLKNTEVSYNPGKYFKQQENVKCKEQNGSMQVKYALVSGFCKAW